MDISIIIPHKNSSETLDSLLLSLTNTSVTEIIVVDDNSQEAELTKLNKLKSKYEFNLIKCDETVTAGGARNIGLNNAGGEWVLFADADDEFVPESLEKLFKVLMESNSDVVYFNCESKFRAVTSEVSHRTDFINDLITSSDSLKGLLPFRWNVPWGRAIKRSILIDHKICFEERPCGNDVFFSAHLALKTYRSYGVYRQTVYRCYESTNSLTATLNSHKAFHRLQALCNKNTLIIGNGIPIRLSYGSSLAKVLIKSFELSNYSLLPRWLMVCHLTLLHNISVFFKNFFNLDSTNNCNTRS